MSQRFDLLILNGAVYTPGGLVQTDIGVRDGRVAELGSLSGADAADRIDAHGLTVLPGVIDTQVHFREPGLEHKEDIETGTRGAVLGGVTGIFEMPNTKPPTTTREALADKLKRSEGRAWCDYAYFVGATEENATELAELEMLPGCAGVKLFMGSSTGNLLVAESSAVESVLRHGFRRVPVHSEDEARMRERWSLVENGAHVKMHPEWRDVEAAIRNTRRLIEIATKVGRRVHVLHITTADEIEFLAGHKTIATVEVTPQHLTFAGPEDYERLGSRVQMNPPVRDAHHREGLWRGIEQGIVDVLGSDHAPHTLEEKGRPYPQSPSGMTGVQTLLPVMLDHVAAGRLSLQRLVDLTSAGPARIYNIAGKGRIGAGFDADFAIVDLAKKWTITDKWIASRSGWTPYDGVEVTGRPIHTVIRGGLAVRDGELASPGLGQPVRFLETIPRG
ncbi:MAG: dihydroorotase [Bryobacterales bacterium]